MTRTTGEPGGTAGGVSMEVGNLLDAYRSHERDLFRLCLRRLGSPVDAEDAVQETFMRAGPRLSSLTGNVGAYLSVVAQRVCCDELRRRRRTGGPPAANAQASDVSDPERAALDRTLLRTIWNDLSVAERGLIAQAFAGLSRDEIARDRHSTPNAVTVALTRARQHARRLAASMPAIIPAPRVFWRSAGRFHRSSGVSIASVPAASLLVAAVGALVAGVAFRPAPDPTQPTIVSTTAERFAATAPGQPTADERRAATAPPAGPRASRTDPPATMGSTTPAVAPSPPATASDLASKEIDGILRPGESAQHTDATFSSVTVSPSYSQDRTVFASGVLANGCGRPTCPVLFRTEDAGRTWQHMPAAGFAGGTVLLPTAYPQQSIMFANGPTGLQRSDDGGETFHLVAPVIGPAAIVPGSPGGADVLIGSQPTWLYHATNGTLVHGPALPSDLAPPDDIAFAGSGTRFLVTTEHILSTHALSDAVVLSCDLAGACRSVLEAPGEAPLHLHPSATAQSDHLIATYSGEHVFLSTDGGFSFRTVSLEPGGAITAVEVDSRGPGGCVVLVATTATDNAGHLWPILWSSHNGGTSVERLTTHGLDEVNAIMALRMARDGHLFAGFAGGGSVSFIFGMRCSTDGALRWGQACA